MFNSGHPVLFGAGEPIMGAAEFLGENCRFDRRRATGTRLEEYGISIAGAKAAAAEEANHSQ